MDTSNGSPSMRRGEFSVQRSSPSLSSLSNWSSARSSSDEAAMVAWGQYDSCLWTVCVDVVELRGCR